MAFKSKLVLIRFSSLGDILQAYAAAQAIRVVHPKAEIAWVTRSDFASLLKGQAAIDQVISFDRKSGVRGLITIARTIAQFDPDLIYDAHSNIRSRLLCGLVTCYRWANLKTATQVIRRPKQRLSRFLFLVLRLSQFRPEKIGVQTYLNPLVNSGFLSETQKLTADFLPPGTHGQARHGALKFSPLDLENKLELTATHRVGIVPSAAWPNKRWPLEYFKRLMTQIFSKSPDTQFVVFGGPEDQFALDLLDVFQDQNQAHKIVFSGIGQWSLIESAKVVQSMTLMIGNDTGIMHLADRLQVPAFFLIGPTAFGYPFEKTSHVLELPDQSLSCKPCSKDGSRACINSTRLKCLWDLTPEMVFAEVVKHFDSRDQVPM